MWVGLRDIGHPLGAPGMVTPLGHSGIFLGNGLVRRCVGVVVVVLGVVMALFGWYLVFALGYGIYALVAKTSRHDSFVVRRHQAKWIGLSWPIHLYGRVFGKRTDSASSPSARPTRREGPQGGATASFIGRKFTSSLSMKECLDAFDAAKADCYRTTGPLLEVDWRMPGDLGAFRSSQGRAPEVPPARVVACDLLDGGRIYLAVWNGMTSYGDASGSSGQPCEMWFVPPGFDTSPIPIAGRWKSRDASLSSIGYVESPLWGAVT
jgi:hypothetical protein